MTSMLGPNRHLIGRDGDTLARELATPALMVDLDAFEANIATMATLAEKAGRKLRPHAKAHKSGIVGKRQIDAGAVGLCCATVLEAEVLADAGLPGLLVTTPVVTPSMVARLALRRREGRRLHGAGRQPRRRRGLRRPCAPRPADRRPDRHRHGDGPRRRGIRARRRWRWRARIAALPQLRYDGVQAYYGHLQHVKTVPDRHVKVAEQWDRLAPILDALTAAGFPPAIISGGGTGTHHLDMAHGPFTEIQPGSYIFLDKQYGEVEIAPGGSPFRTSLTVAARVVSTVQPDRVIIDAGSKAVSTDYGPALVARGAPEGSTYQFMGDEHGAIRVPEGAARPPLGGIVELIAPHCDPDRQPARPVPRHAGRPARRHLAHRSARALRTES